MRYRVLKPWRYSRRGYDVNTAAAGEVMDLAPELGAAGVSTGHLEPDAPKAAPETQAMRSAPEVKRRPGRPRKASS